MNWDEDIDLLTTKKSSKQGRKASNAPAEADRSILSPSEIPKRRAGGWGEEAAKPKSKQGGSFEEEVLQNTKRRDSDEKDIPVIPDIDDLQDDPLNLQDVKVPVIRVKKSTYKELDNQFEHFQTSQPSFGNLGDIDLSLLTSKLYSEKECQRPNEVWTMESLFRDIKSYHSN